MHQSQPMPPSETRTQERYCFVPGKFPEATIYDYVRENNIGVEAAIALDYLGMRISYGTAFREVDTSRTRRGPLRCSWSAAAAPAKAGVYRAIHDSNAARAGDVALIYFGKKVAYGYLGELGETAAVRPHADGLDWLHSDDLGRVDADGFAQGLATRCESVLDERRRSIGYRIVEGFPLTKVGKVDYQELERRAAE